MVGARSNIIGFSKEADSFSENFVLADIKSIEQARNWLKQMDPRNALPKGKDAAQGSDFSACKDERHTGTRADLALELEFEQSLGLVIFLSDGEPTGKSSNEVLEMTSALLQKHKVAINATSYKSQDGRKFLEELAKISGDTYTILK